ncbi:MAG: DNA mismatch repair protein MutS [Chloroflexota bacterium]
MKVYLLHRDRDFDLKQNIPSNAQALTQDLELNTLFTAMASKDKYLFNVAQQAVLTGLSDPDAILFRQDILRDCLKNPMIVREIYHIPIESIEKKHGHWMGITSRYPSSVLNSAIQLLEMFVELLKKLKKIADEHAVEFESEGFKRFFAMIQQELSEDYFSVVENHLKELKFRGGVLLSAELGKGNEGENYILRKSNHNGNNWVRRIFARKSPVYSFTLHPRDDAGARAIGDLRDAGINLVANAAAQSADHIDSFLNALRLDLAFYIGCLNLYDQVSQLGEPISFPIVAEPSERRHAFSGLYDICLALTMEKKVVGNDINADGRELVIITGANQGGKSTFLRSIGLAQLMMQCGMFVPAESFSANLCTGLFTHYKREEDASMRSGKLDEELSRMSLIVDNINSNSLMLFNESFSATNEREGSEIARQVTNALLDGHIKIFFVTHQYELAHGFYNLKMKNAFFMRADRKTDGERTFKVIEGRPLQTSYGKDLYHKVFGKLT